jgi:hypothetical protein
LGLPAVSGYQERGEKETLQVLALPANETVGFQGQLLMSLAAFEIMVWLWSMVMVGFADVGRPLIGQEKGLRMNLPVVGRLGLCPRVHPLDVLLWGG